MILSLLYPLSIPRIVSDGEILLVDDEQDIVSVFSSALEKTGLKISAFTSPKDAMEYYRQNSDKVKLIVSDIKMPEMNGFEFAFNIREINPAAKVLLATAYENGDLESA